MRSCPTSYHAGSHQANATRSSDNRCSPRYKVRPQAGGLGPMTRDEKIRLAVSVARAAARSGEYRRLDKLIELIFRKLNELAPPGSEEEVERDFKL